jgi:hypothetical protein
MKNTKIIPGYKTDHSAITFTFSASLARRGKGYWKFNSQLLRDFVYVEKVFLIKFFFSSLQKYCEHFSPFSCQFAFDRRSIPSTFSSLFLSNSIFLLFKDDCNDESFFNHNIKLTEEQKYLCEGNITFKECAQSLKLMTNVSLIINGNRGLILLAITAEAILRSVFNKLIGLQFPIKCLSFPTIFTKHCIQQQI